jgi:hypothetical protein
MIHQHIFASPKPGMTEAEFQDYWLNVHAVKYASKIPQIKKYKLCMRVDWKYESPQPLWSGFAEIWLNNEQEQLASLQTPEFLEGARLDEPRWAAFWNTQVLDCDTVTVMDKMGEVAPPDAVKMSALLKRKPGMTVEEYRKYHLDVHAPLSIQAPGILRHDVCFTRDSWYVVGEPRFDSVVHFWFENVAAAEALAESAEYRANVVPDDDKFLDPKYVFHMVSKEHWVIGPEARP